MSARSRIVGPGRPPSISAVTEVVVPPSRGSSPRPRSASATTACVSGSWSPRSGRRWSRRRTSTTSGRIASAAGSRAPISAPSSLRAAGEVPGREVQARDEEHALPAIDDERPLRADPADRARTQRLDERLREPQVASPAGRCARPRPARRRCGSARSRPASADRGCACTRSPDTRTPRSTPPTSASSDRSPAASVEVGTERAPRGRRPRPRGRCSGRRHPPLGPCGACAGRRA